ncbi:hypothetical protein KBC75_05080 [Candidatus Shapirobacteria bacterium]|nr:hypothetical protein [Candidatus Shapirobacteria bacterium]
MTAKGGICHLTIYHLSFIKMRKIVLGMLLSGLLLGGCGVGTAKPATTQKIQELVVEKTGVIQAKVGDEYVLKTDSEVVNITSTKTNLDNYMKKKVTVKGMFSGSTLYVDKIETGN